MMWMECDWCGEGPDEELGPVTQAGDGQMHAGCRDSYTGHRLSNWPHRPRVGYPVGAAVAYSGDLPCDEAVHAGTVLAVHPDASMGEVVTVRFDGHDGCTLADHVPEMTQDILASELEPYAADYNLRAWRHP